MAQLSLVASLTSVSSPKASASPSFTSSWPRFLKEFFTIWKRKAWKSPVCAGTLWLNEFHRGHQAAFGSRLVLNHLATKSKISGGFGSQSHLCPDNFPESAVGEGSKLGDAFLAPLNRADRSEKKRLRDWLESLNENLTPARVHSTAWNLSFRNSVFKLNTWGKTGGDGFRINNGMG